MNRRRASKMQEQDPIIRREMLMPNHVNQARHGLSCVNGIQHDSLQSRQAKAVEEVREYTERTDVAPAEAFGSLADKLRGALKPRAK